MIVWRSGYIDKGNNWVFVFRLRDRNRLQNFRLPTGSMNNTHVYYCWPQYDILFTQINARIYTRMFMCICIYVCVHVSASRWNRSDADIGWPMKSAATAAAVEAWKATVPRAWPYMERFLCLCVACSKRLKLYRLTYKWPAWWPGIRRGEMSYVATSQGPEETVKQHRKGMMVCAGICLRNYMLCKMQAGPW